MKWKDAVGNKYLQMFTLYGRKDKQRHTRSEYYPSTDTVLYNLD